MEIETIASVKITLNKQELEVIRDLVQNAHPDDSPEIRQIKVNIFVGCMRGLGYTMNDDGSMLE